MNFPKRICTLACSLLIVTSMNAMSYTYPSMDDTQQHQTNVVSDYEFTFAIESQVFSKRNKKAKRLKGKRNNQKCPMFQKSNRKGKSAYKKLNKKTSGCYSATKGLRRIF